MKEKEIEELNIRIDSLEEQINQIKEFKFDRMASFYIKFRTKINSSKSFLNFSSWITKFE